MTLIELAERRWLPDPVIRFGIRRLLSERLTNERRMAGSDGVRAVEEFARRLRASEVAIETQRANEQHYEVAAEFFELVLGDYLKYSSGLWSASNGTLTDAEEAMLAETCSRAGIEDGMEVLELGCGWGSLTLWIAEHFPNCRILGLSNSVSQREFIVEKCEARGWHHVDIATADVADFQTERRFDRVVSVEMFEHVRNYRKLLHRIAQWMKPDAALFVHIFCHREFAYAFETAGDKNWMGRTFFTGGIMPSEDLFLQFQDDLQVQRRWWIEGTHYARTCEAWLANLDRHHDRALEVLASSSNPSSAEIQLQQWRIFFMACAELFAYRGGNEWGVSHYLFTKHS